MGGVLIDYNPEKTLYGMFDKETADIALREIFRNELWREKDRGTVTAEEILEKKGHLIPPHAYEKVADMTLNLYPYMPPLKQTEEIVKRIKNAGYKLFLLSNASADFYENKSGIPALDLFDGYLISADYKLLKPEREIYEELYEVFALNPEECIFIDDVEENCDASRKTGMKAFCFENKDTDKLTEFLRENGVNI